MTPKEAYKKCFIEKKRIPELEGIISIDPYYSFLYACHIIKGRFEKGERSIANNAEYSYNYARYLIEKEFPLCHYVIFNSEYRYRYVNFLKSINYDLTEISEWLI